MRPDHPVVAVGVDNRAATIAPNHVHDRTLRSSPQFRRFLNYFVDVLDVYIKERRERLQRFSQFAFPSQDSLDQASELCRAR